MSLLRTARTAGVGGDGSPIALLPLSGATWSSMPRSIGIAAAPMPITCEKSWPMPSAPFSTVSWPMLPNAFAASADDLRELLGDLLADHGLLVLRERRGAGLDRLGLREPLRLDGLALGQAAALVAAPSASPICLVRVAVASASSFTRFASAPAESSTSRAFPSACEIAASRAASAIVRVL